MALVTLQRSPTPSAASTASTATTAAGEDYGSDDERRLNQSLSESFFMVKGAALFLQQGASPPGQQAQPHHQHAGDLPQHLQVMINILRSEDRIKLAVRLESGWSERVRYMVVVYTNGRQDTEENILLGMDFTNKDSKNCSIGMVLPLWSDTKIHLDGDGGFTVNTAERTHVFKPVSVQAMWSALQILHKACEVSRRHNYFPGGMALTWLGYYESCISSEQSCINQWNAMRDLETTRPDSPDMFVDKPSERERTEGLLKAKLRNIMSYQDLDNVTSKQIRTELEQHMSCNLNEYKEFIDNEMLLILGQMDKATLIFEHLYLGSEWNASNLEELQETGVGYILNVTREIDNFFPGTFCYHNVRVYDEEATDLLAHWNYTYNFILKAKKSNSKCLVHCKMGVSRSASTVIAYAMKQYGWSLEKAYGFVKQRRSITRPNAAFMRQLAEYEGILDASKQRHNRLWHPDIDCEMSTDSHQGSSQCCQRAPEDGPCGGSGGAGSPSSRLTPGQAPEDGSVIGGGTASPSSCLTPGRAPGLEVDPAYNNYYFRRLSDSALDSEPSTPVRGPAPLLNVEKVFIEIEDVERDALLDDEAPAPGLEAEGLATPPGPLEELRLRLEFSTVEEEDEEEVRKEEAEMEVLMHPDRGGGGGGDGGTGMDLASLNESSNNNNNNKLLAETAPSNTHTLHPCPPPWPGGAGPDAQPCLNPSLPSIQALSGTTSNTSPGPLNPPAMMELFLQPACNPPSSSSSSSSSTTSSSSSSSSSPPPALPYDGPEDSSRGEPVLEEHLPELLSMEAKMEESHGHAHPQGLQVPQDPQFLQAPQGPQDPQVLQVPQGLQDPQGLQCLQVPHGLVRRRAQRLETPERGLLQHTCRSSLHFEAEEQEDQQQYRFLCDLPSSPRPPACSAGPDPPAGSSGGSSPRCSLPLLLTRSSSSDSVRSVCGGAAGAGLVRRRALEIEACTRLAGLTMPSPLKRSSSLAKLDGLQLSRWDLCSACSSSSDAGSLALAASLSPEPGAGQDCLALRTVATTTSSSSSTSSSPRSGPGNAGAGENGS